MEKNKDLNEGVNYFNRNTDIQEIHDGTTVLMNDLKTDIKNSLKNDEKSFNNQNSFQTKNNTREILMFVSIAVVATTVIILLIFLVFGNKRGNSASYENLLKEQQKQRETEEKELKEINNNFDTKDYVLSNGNILVEITNKNDSVVNANIKVEFLDKNNNVVDVEDGTLTGIIKNNEVYKEIYVDKKMQYSSYRTNVKLEKGYDFYQYKDKVSLESKKSNDNIIVTITNNEKERISSLEVGIVFYDKSNKIVGYSNTNVKNINSGEKTTSKVIVPFDKSFKRITYDRIETLLISAYTDKL